jgi:uncharacterized protein YcfJ
MRFVRFKERKMSQVIRPIAAVAAVLGAALVSPPTFAAELATVVSSTPVMAQVPVPRQQCAQGEQYVQQAPTGIGAVVGAVAGGVIGNAIGGGFGRAAATGLGVVAGSVVGNQAEANANPVTAVPVTRCQTVTSYESRVVGYDVTYDYAGQRYTTRMASNPGRQFAVDVRPAGAAAPAPLPAQAYSDPGAPAYYDPLPQPVYAAPYPYYAPSPYVYGAPVIGVGVGYYGGWRGRHWH